MNRAIICGRLGTDPEGKSTKGGTVCRFSVATNEKYTGRDRDEHEEVEWHRVIVFGSFADACLKNLSKGNQVLVEGKIKTRSYEKDGVKKYVTEILAARVMFLGRSQQPAEVKY